MTQYIIDIGAVPDDGQGDPLRTAFDYTNENFNQIFAAGPVLSNIQIGNNTITTTVLNSNLILSPSGIGRIQLNNTLFPRLDNVYDIGTPSLRFNSVYLGTGGIDTTGGITTTGNITANYFIGNGSQLTGIVATTGSEVVNGTSNILIPSPGSNIFVTVNGTSNVVTFANTGVYVAGQVSATGNISGNYILGNGALLSGINIGYGNSNVADFLPTYTGNLVSLTGPVTTTANVTGGNLRTAGQISATGNITGGNVATGRLNAGYVTVGTTISAIGNITTSSYFIGDGSLLTGINANYGNANVAAFLPTYTGNLASLTGPVTTTANVSGGNLQTSGTILASGNITAANLDTNRINAANITASGLISAVANITTSAYFIGDGSQLTNLPAGNYSNANVAAYLPTYTGSIPSLTGLLRTTANIVGGNISIVGNITGGNVDVARVNAGNVTVSGPVSATGNITTAAYFIGDGSQLTNLPAGNYSNANVAAFLPTYTGNLVSLTGPVTTTATITGGNLQTSGQISATGNITGGNVDASRVNANTVTVTTTISAGGNITGNNIVGTTVTGTTVTAIANVVAGNVTTSGQVSATGNIQGGNLNAPGGTITSYIVSATGQVQGGNLLTTGYITATGNITGGNVDTGNLHAGNANIDGNVAAQYYYGNGSQLTGIIASSGSSIDYGNSNVKVNGVNGNVSISINNTSNVAVFATTGEYVSGVVSATGNVSGNYFIGNGAFLTGLAASYGNADVANYLPTYTGNLVSLTGPVITTANITGGNILTGGRVSATGNVSGNYILGNGALLTGVITSVANINNGTSNVTVVSSGGNVTVGVGGTSNVAVFATTGEYITGVLSVSGNVTGDNITTAGQISAAGNIAGNYFFGNGSQITGVTASAVNANALIGNTLSSNVLYSSLTQVGTLANLTVTGNTVGGNLLTGGLVSATGNITGGNIVTSGSGGNISGANVISGTTLSATANVVGGNINTAGVITAGGNISGNNVFATGFASVTGNVIAGNVNTSAIQPTNGALTITTASGNLNLQPVGNIVLANTFINSVAYPEQDGDAATKLYVDNMVSTALSFHSPVYAATTTDLATATSGTITYAQPNGASNGIGAYLSTTGSFDLIDTANVQTVGTRILVKNEGNAVYNGVYTWSNATAIVRSTDADQYGPNSAEQLSLNDYFFTTNGNVNAGSAFVVNEPTGTITFGTSNISFALFSQATTYTANTNAGLSLIGTQFNAKVDNDTTAFDVAGNIIVKASANLTTPNIGAATGTSLSTTGNVNSGNVNTGGLISATGNLIAGNILTIGKVSATGNVTGDYFFGNGSQLTGVAADSVNANALVGNTLSSNVLYSSLTQVGTLANLSVAGNIAGGNILSDNYYYANGTPVPPGITYTANIAPPTSPAPKVTDQWYDTSNDVLYEFLNDGTSEYWVDTNSPAFAGGVVANVAISGNMLPVANVTFNIGNSSAYFNTAFLQTASVAGNVVAGTVRSDTVVASVLANATAINLQTNGTNALSVDSNQYITTYRRFAASSMPLGSVVQTVMSTSLGGSITNSTSYADITYATVTITPSSATSKIMILATGTTSFTPLVSANVTADTQLVRSPSVSLQIQNYGSEIAGGGVGGAGSIAYSYQDSPGTTSAVTYKLQQKISNASSTLTSTNIWLIAMEIAA